MAECLGKLTLVDPLRLLPQLKVCVNSQALGISDSVYTTPVKFAGKRSFIATVRTYRLLLPVTKTELFENSFLKTGGI